MTRIKTAWVPVFLVLLSLCSHAYAQQIQISKENYELVKNLRPRNLLINFAKISTIPRCSGSEDAIGDTILALAKRYGLSASKDAAKNIFVVMPATRGYENKDSICIQAHLDMVCQSRIPRDNIFPIQFIVKGDTLKANETTLGADDGVGVASLMAIMESSLPHCKLELLFTADEENGLTGADLFDVNRITSSYMLNVDAEDWGSLTIGCAGGVRMHTIVTPKFIPSGTGAIYTLKVSGLLGGHSGVDIGLNHANAIKLMGKVLSCLEDFDISLISIAGGNKNNTIPRETEAKIFLPGSESEAKFIDAFGLLKQNIILQFPNEHPIITIEKSENNGTAIMDPASQKKILEIITTIPNGVIRYEPADPKLVRTSNNLGIVEMGHDTVIIRTLFRSSKEEQLDSLEGVMNQVFKGQITQKDVRYPAWEPNYKSVLLASVSQQYKNMFGVLPAIRVTHGGLESADFFKKKGFQIVAFGPNAHYTHTPDESVEISSVEKYWKFLCALISKK